MWPNGKVYPLADPCVEKKQNIQQSQSVVEGEMPECQETYGEVVKYQLNRGQDNDLVSSRRYAVSKAESCRFRVMQSSHRNAFYNRLIFGMLTNVGMQV